MAWSDFKCIQSSIRKLEQNRSMLGRSFVTRVWSLPRRITTYSPLSPYIKVKDERKVSWLSILHKVKSILSGVKWSWHVRSPPLDTGQDVSFYTYERASIIRDPLMTINLYLSYECQSIYTYLRRMASFRAFRSDYVLCGVVSYNVEKHRSMRLSPMCHVDALYDINLKLPRWRWCGYWLLPHEWYRNMPYHLVIINEKLDRKQACCKWDTQWFRPYWCRFHPKVARYIIFSLYTHH